MAETANSLELFRRNNEDMGTMSSMDLATSSVISRHKDEQVILVSDIHTEADKIYNFGSNLAKQTKSVLAIEMMMPEIQPFLNALTSGKITKDEFKQITPNLWLNDKQIPRAGTPHHYMGIERGNKFYETLIDAAATGTPIYAIGRMEGMAGQSDSPEQARTNIENMTAKNRITLDVFLTAKRDAQEIKNDPKAYLEKLTTEVSKNMDSYPSHSQQAMKELLQKIDETTEMSYGDHMYAIESLLSFRNPNWEDYAITSQKLNDLNTQPLKTYSDQEILEIRMGLDKNIAEDIKSIAAKHGSVTAIYGINHMSHNESYGGDIDSHLRDGGIHVMVVDPVVSTPSPDSPFTSVQPRQNRESDDEIYRKNARDDKDLNRIEVNLDTGKIEDISASAQAPSLIQKLLPSAW